MKKYVLVCVIVFTACTIALSQDNLKIQTKVPYYINVNNAVYGHVYEIYDGFVNLEFSDNIGLAKEVELLIYNWKSEVVGNFKLDKVLGLNHYSFEFKDVGVAVEFGTIYRCVMMDETKNKFEFSLRNNKKPENDRPVPSITVKAINVSCQNPKQGSLVEFYGNITGGRAPYVINWYVINEGKTIFLYQPKEEKIQQSGIVSAITVDKDPSYNVMLLVTDACGNVGKKMVFVSCKEENKRINTIFVEPLNGVENLISPTRSEN
jgi:hypothetical protein